MLTQVSDAFSGMLEGSQHFEAQQVSNAPVGDTVLTGMTYMN